MEEKELPSKALLETWGLDLHASNMGCFLDLFLSRQLLPTLQDPVRMSFFLTGVLVSYLLNVICPLIRLFPLGCCGPLSSLFLPPFLLPLGEQITSKGMVNE